MSLLFIAALIASQPAIGSPPKRIFTAEETVTLSERAQKQCGYSSPADLVVLPKEEREKTLSCFIRATVERSALMLPKLLEPGATIVSVSIFKELPVFDLQFGADHPRASVPLNQTSEYDRLLSNRTCDDKWLGGLIDAGVVDGAQGGTVIVYKLQTDKQEVLAIVAVAQCHDP